MLAEFVGYQRMSMDIIHILKNNMYSERGDAIAVNSVRDGCSLRDIRGLYMAETSGEEAARPAASLVAGSSGVVHPLLTGEARPSIRIGVLWPLTAGVLRPLALGVLTRSLHWTLTPGAAL